MAVKSVQEELKKPDLVEVIARVSKFEQNGRQRTPD
jgi:hypothetical protein